MQPINEYKKANENEIMRLVVLKWLCDKQPWAAGYMHELSNLLGREFTTKDLPLKNSRSYELIKEWEKKGLIRITNYTSKARKYAFTTTLFADAIESKDISRELKDDILNKLEELILPNE